MKDGRTIDVHEFEKKIQIMKYFAQLLISGLILIFTFSCGYDDFKEDYDYSTVYFTNQILKRTFVEDEFDQIKVGVVLGGKRLNSVDEWVRFTCDDTSGMSQTSYELLPESYYTLSNYEEIEISTGEFMGEITMTIDPSFYQDPMAVEDHYVLPFKLYDTSADSILAMKDSLLLILTFENRIFGNYYHSGRVFVDSAGAVIDTIIYHGEEPVTEPVNSWFLGTQGSKTLYTRGIGNYAPSDLTGFYIRIDDDNSLSFSEDTALVNLGFDWQFKEQPGDNYYDPETRMLYLNYSYVDLLSGNDCHATDTLIFRNRILDGVNQWEF
jgi:hypothetical protein